ncbi:hypothetical protein GCM10022419_088350 [Nonomuraea rosea]|uniref:Uncharacterized protein n=1 Tax=Nonomuraea rosea TaxID=638574 RepID=A0ABP6Z0K9_9ACTN
MGRYSSVDWIRFEWDERRTGLGPVQSSLEDTRGWYHQLGPWLDPGPAAGVSICRLVVDERVVVLARTRSGGSDSRRTLRVHAYLGGSVTRPSAMPNVRQALALAPGWAAQLPEDPEPLDLARLLAPYAESSVILDRQARAGAAALAPIVSELLRGHREALSVASHGQAIVQLWGLVDVLDQVLGLSPETFSTYESDDLKQGAEVIFLQQWPGPSSRAARRWRVDLRAPDQDDLYGEIAAMVVGAYAHRQLGALVKRLGITEGMPLEERVERLISAAQEPPAAPRATQEPVRPASRADPAEPWAPRPPARPSPDRATQPRLPPQSRALEDRALEDRAQEGRVGEGRAQEGRTTERRMQEGRAAEGGAQEGSSSADSEARGPSSPGAAAGSRSGLASPLPPSDAHPDARPFVLRDVFEDFRADLADATTAAQARGILEDVRAWAATQRPAEVRPRLLTLVPELERLLPDDQVNPVLRALLTPAPPPSGQAVAGRPAGRSAWLEPRWLIIVAALSIVIVLQLVAALR